ncbi:MAG TPA: CRISPR-associated helicase Cas3' [Anaerolineae bacterium]|nr:CRISPR-associated helicase Cas3' [Anaerolineae bacterium]
MAKEPLHHLLWAKKEENGRYHPLICHLIDVAEVAQALWDEVLTDSIRAHYCSLLDLPPEQARALLSLWVGLHDLGKATPVFQGGDRAALERLSGFGLKFPTRFVAQKPSHGAISAKVLAGLLESETGVSADLAKLAARAVGGHHGTWPLLLELQRLGERELGGDEWGEVRRHLLRELVGLLNPPSLGAFVPPGEENPLVMLLSGLCVTADWVGSMETYFPFSQTPIHIDEYIGHARTQAHRALQELGWAGWSPPTTPLSLENLCNVARPRPMQEAVIALAQSLKEPALVIIEAPTGVGKTEAALYLADHWAVTCQQRGLYVAMPTMATSNQMYGRVQQVLRHRYPDSLVNLHLVHSQARWREDVTALQLDTAEEAGGGKVAAMTWFLPRKRTLLAPFGVGTVDQALLSVLQARHFFLRLFGLSHKTVIFDEVHAYDTYMSTIFQRLLGWLRCLGTSVVVLSATLPKQTRRELLRAYSGRDAQFAEMASYPTITWTMGDQSGVVPLEKGEERVLALDWIGREPEAIVGRLRTELREGGCAAVICNTVGRAQGVYRALRSLEIMPREDLHLFHARFPLAWRDEIEATVLSAFGKNGVRPRRAVVVATQVIEQSLDLDFDLMISDLAPVDLLIQRAGRLHRHTREGRPASCAQPRLLVARPPEVDGTPAFEADVYVYEPYVLLSSYLALQGRDRLTLPADTEMLIEAVYGDQQPPAQLLTVQLSKVLAEAEQKMRRHEEEHVYKARQKLVPDAGADDLLGKRSLGLEEDSPELHEAFQALTRLGRPGISLVCLHRGPGGLTVEPDGSGPAVSLEEPPTAELTSQLAMHTVSVTPRPVFDYLRAQPVPVGWKDHPLLRNHRVAVFTDGLCALPGTHYTLRLTREFGLEVSKEGGVDESHV